MTTFASIKATAPTGTHIEQLGVPFDREFNQIPTDTLFPDAPSPRRVDAVGFKHESLVVDTEEQLAANAKGWGIVQLSSTFAHENRFAAYRAYQLSHVEILDDSSAMREPPAQASYYAWKIYYGRSYEAVVTGSARNFNAAARASFLSFEGGVSGFTKKYALSVQAAGVGLRPRSGEAIFAKTTHDIEAFYEAAGEVMPIFVEYRKIPLRVSTGAPIKWMVQRILDLQFDSLRVHEDGTAGSTPWRFRVTCKHNGERVLSEDLWDEELRVSEGQKVPLGWSHRFDVAEGDAITCETGGSLHDHITSLQALPPGRINLIVGEEPQLEGIFDARGAKAAYSISWKARYGVQ